MSEPDKKIDNQKNETVASLFKKAKAKNYQLPAFCLFAKLAPEAKITEQEFNKKLKEFLNHPLK